MKKQKAEATAEVEPKGRITAEIVGRLRDLEDKWGRLDTRIVLEDAASPDSPTHGSFEWDDTVAGAAFRLEQARTLIRRVKFEVIIEEVPTRVVKYVRDPGRPAESMYRSIPRIRSATMAAGVMAAELARILGNVDRSLGIARVKAAQLPAGVVEGLVSVQEQVRAMLADCRG